ncbi:MAG: PHP domain-containing protein [Acidobacteria bacterium]|nr:PHP domain-containing protein [Acidobacteriota bacterium]
MPVTPAGAQSRAIEFPDVGGYRTLAVDLHTHSVFSDGSVWPVIRVQESERDGVALLAVTEHLEYQPRAADIPNPDRNRAFAVAAEYAGAEAPGVIVVNGAEISRDMPPGHCNAVFLSDANALLRDDVMEVFEEANRQDAFVFWNHPNWIPQRRDGVARLTDMHRGLIADGLLHGIEVANAHVYSAEALQIALDYDLAILGVSDIHGLVDWEYDVHGGGHRTVTLVLAEERTAESIREALHANRTAAWKDNELIGREEVVVPLLEASLRVLDVRVRRGSVLTVTLVNRSGASFNLLSVGPQRFYDRGAVVNVGPYETVAVSVTGENRADFELSFAVLNALVAPETHPTLQIAVEVPE